MSGLHHGKRADGCPERISQLMSEHGQEFVLRPVGPFRIGSRSVGFGPRDAFAIQRRFERRIGLGSSHAERHVVSHAGRQRQLLEGEPVRRVVVEHELAEEAVLVQDGHEGQRPDPLAQDDITQTPKL